jgi:hypothetical protein
MSCTSYLVYVGTIRAGCCVAIATQQPRVYNYVRFEFITGVDCEKYNQNI